MSRLVLGVMLVAATAAAQVPATAETQPILSTGVGDVAIVPNHTSPEQSLVAGVDTLQVGLYVFGLDGGAAQPALQLGPARGVSAKTGLAGAASTVVLVGSANLGTSIHGLADSGVLTPIGKRLISGASVMAMWVTPSGALEAWLDTGGATLLRVALVSDSAAPGMVDWAALDASVTFPRPITAVAIDEANRRLYATSLDGISGWTIDGPSGPDVLELVDGGGLGGVSAGLALYPLRDGGALLLAAVPSREDIAVYRAVGTGLELVGRFSVTIGARQVRNVEFIDVTQAALPGFPRGMVVLSDRNATT
ncbi:MAG: hypothetical protein JNG84_11855, partial [Archangium sp.]|nr:hypothetical protein [Archangium sp.]